MKVYGPITGKIKALEEVNDEAFSLKLMGDGIAVVPREGTVYAPVSGEVTMIFPTKHALGITTKEGIDILLHIGIDTVELKGEGFTCMVKENSPIRVGDVLVNIDIEYMKKAGYETDVVMIMTNLSEHQKVKIVASGDIVHGDRIIEIV